MPRFGQNRKRESGRKGAPQWVVTYGDMMSLLLTFFILLLSFSTITEEKFEQAVHSLQRALGLMPASLSIVPLEQDAQAMRRSPRSIERVAREMRRRLQVLGREQDVDLEFDEGGIRLSLPSQVLFDTARSELKPEAFGILDNVAEVFVDVPEAVIEVRGHTDSRPLVGRGRYEDNHDLSYGRAKSVATFLNQSGGLALEQFEIVALGPTRPVATNETSEGRQKNRRVELHVRGDFGDDSVDEIRERVEMLSGGPAGAERPALERSSSARF